jgi:diguanylate cyclase (GGDEF)-like protein
MAKRSETRRDAMVLALAGSAAAGLLAALFAVGTTGAMHVVVVVAIAVALELAVVLPLAMLLTERRAARATTEREPTSVAQRLSAPPRSRLVASIEAAIASDGEVAVLIVDLDGFKLINEGFGHVIGDQVIATTTARLERFVGEAGMVVHLGGDEFGVVLHAPTDFVVAEQRAAALDDVISAPIHADSIEIAVTASIGVAVSVASENAADVLDHASMAAHRAKRSGGRRVVLYDDSLRDLARNRIALSAALRHAVFRDELRLEFQTVNNLASGRPVAVEALVRWNHPTLGVLLPEHFIPMAEDIGTINALGQWVLERACREVRAMDAATAGRGALGIWINVSPLQLASPGFAKMVREALVVHGIAAHRLTLEITESTLMDDLDHAGEVLTELHDIGVRVAIDDFGTGYSALAYLDELPVDVVKIDRCLVARLADGGDSAVVASVIRMGAAKGLMVVAEGVETAEQQSVLRSLGCSLAQGWFYSRSMPIEELVDHLGQLGGQRVPTGA